VTLVASKQAARHAEIDLSSLDMHEGSVRGREEPIVVYAVPDPPTMSELMAVDSRRSRISDNPIV